MAGFEKILPDVLNPKTWIKHALAGLSYPASKAQILAHVKNSTAPAGLSTKAWDANKMADSIGKRISDRHNYDSMDEVIGDVTKYN